MTFNIRYNKLSFSNTKISDHLPSSFNEKKYDVLLSEIGRTEPKGLFLAKERIARGEKIASTLLHSPLDAEHPSTESALDLTWFLMAKAFQENGDVFFRGTVRVSNLSTTECEAFMGFFARCKEAGAHNRPSSHFKKETMGSQKGLDFCKGSLPLDPELSTLLCGSLREGGFFIKLEREALALTKPVSSIKHLWNWVKHSTSKGGNTFVGERSTRRETDGIHDLRVKLEKVVSRASLVSNELYAEIEGSKRHIHVHQMHRTASKISMQLEKMRLRGSEESLCRSSISEDSSDDATADALSLVNHDESSRKGSPVEPIEELEEALSEFNAELSAKKIRNPTIANGMEVIISLKEE